ncbi:hypothetical protein J6590_030444 [Homalodisca vitripennis]|nr:hypothetical protein J6590_030444 [Homalodisca vitripennis]
MNEAELWYSRPDRARRWGDLLQGWARGSCGWRPVNMQAMPRLLHEIYLGDGFGVTCALRYTSTYGLGVTCALRHTSTYGLGVTCALRYTSTSE